MILQIDEGLTFLAHFRHVQIDGRWQTHCSVHCAPCLTQSRPCGTETKLNGVAKVSEKDSFCRATGRKIAFTKAIQTLPRSERRLLWAAYFSKNRVPVQSRS